MEVRLDPVLPSLSIVHRVDNLGSHPLELAPWSITQLPLGGEALLPLRWAIAGHETRPNRAFVLWPYSSLDDPRLHIRDGLVTVDAVAGNDLKVGCLDDSGWVAYVRDGVANRAPLRTRRGRAASRPRLQRGDLLRLPVHRARGPRPAGRPGTGRIDHPGRALGGSRRVLG